MQITTTHEITPRRIADLMVTAIEGGIGYWCSGVKLRSAGDVNFDRVHKGPWYDNPEVYENPELKIEVIEAEGSDGTENVTHTIGLKEMEKGFVLLQTFGADHCKGYCWRDFLNDNEDAITADVWLQLATFGELVYG